MTDAAVDREIEALLAVDPSPEFASRVRQRLAAEPQPSPRRAAWRLLAVCAAAAGIVVAALVSRPRPAAPEALLTARVLPNTTMAMAGAQGWPSHDAATVRHRFGGGTSGRRSEPDRERRPVTAAPDVLLDARETAALRALILGTRDGRIDLEPVLHASRPTAMELPPISAIAIAPITIDPLVEEGVRQ